MKTTIFSILAIISILFIAGCSNDNLDTEHSDDELHDYSIEIEGKEMKLLTVEQVADLWEIDSQTLLSEIIKEFDLKESYTVDSILEDIRDEYKFSPAMIKDIAEEIKQQGIAK